MTEAAAQAKKEVQNISFKDGVSTVTIGDAKIEVSADGKQVTAYTSNGVETKPSANSRGSTAAAAEEGAKISISKDFNAVVLNGVTIEQAADGHLVITAPGGIVINKPAVANDTAVKAAKDALEIGDKMADGTVYAGISPTTGNQMFALPADESLTMSWRKAMKVAKKKDAHGHKDYRVPDAEELNVLYQNKDKGALKGTFNASCSGDGGRYWSSSSLNTVLDFYARVQRFSDGNRGSFFNKDCGGSSVRLVRG